MLATRVLAAVATAPRDSLSRSSNTTNRKINSFRVYEGNDFQSLSIATAVFVSWGLTAWKCLSGVHVGITPWYEVAFWALLMEYLYTGLFITAHDAMHGVVCRSSRTVNNAVGWAAATLYAFFDYRMLHKKHWEHHRHAGQVGKDPDFHTGHPGLFGWYTGFMLAYMSPLQLLLLATQSILLMSLLKFPAFNVLLYTAACPIVSSFHLFYFGTYLPHKPDLHVRKDGHWPEDHSRTSDAPWWLTMLQCYNFGLHLEHHTWPAVPWYLLPFARNVRRAWQEGQEGTKGTLKVWTY